MARCSGPLCLALASLFCAALAAAPLPPVVRALGALPLVLYLPGRCCLAAVFPGRRIDGETRVLSAALSLALVILLGVGLAHATSLRTQTWLAALVTVCVVACIVAAFGGRGAPEGAQTANRASLGLLRLVSLAVAVGAAGFAYMDASRRALAQRPDLYTDFWIVPQSGQAPAIATAGVKNQEEREATYAVDEVARGAVVRRLAAFRLHPGETRTFEVPLPRAVFAPSGTRPLTETNDRPSTAGLHTSDEVLGAGRVELRLFKDGNRDVAYRRVWIALPAPIADAVATDEPANAAGDLAYSGSAVGALRASLRAERPIDPGASSLDAARTPRVGPLRDATHELDLSQATALRAPAYDADMRNLGVSTDDPMAGLRSPRFAPDPAAATAQTSPE